MLAIMKPYPELQGLLNIAHAIELEQSALNTPQLDALATIIRAMLDAECARIEAE